MPGDSLSLSGAPARTQHVAHASPEASKAAPRDDLSFEKIDTPLEAVMCPLGNPGVTSYITDAILNGKALDIKGAVSQAEKSYEVDLALRKNDSGSQQKAIIAGMPPEESKGFDYNLKGTLGALGVDVHIYSSGFTLYVEGKVGENPVKIENSYNLFTGVITTKGHSGTVPVNMKTRGESSVVCDGNVGDEKVHNEVNKAEDGSLVIKGSLGDLPLAGASSVLAPGKLLVDFTGGPAASRFEIAYR
jgi:hypothetical protein